MESLKDCDVVLFAPSQQPFKVISVGASHGLTPNLSSKANSVSLHQNA